MKATELIKNLVDHIEKNGDAEITFFVEKERVMEKMVCVWHGRPENITGLTPNEPQYTFHLKK